MMPPLVAVDRARRHEIAAAILAAFATDAELEALQRQVEAAPPNDPAVPRLRAGLAAARAYARERAPGTPLLTSLAESAALLRVGLFFEVHERLEVEWRLLVGPRRAAVQGLIQMVVALHHLAHGNFRGAFSLIAKGRARLERHGGAVPEIDAAAFVAASAPWERAMEMGRWPDELSLPPLLVAGVSCARARPPSA
jgi:hypothetical protein